MLRDEYLRKKRRKRLVRYGAVFLIFVLLIALASYIAHRPSVRISQVELSGGILVTQDDLAPKALSFVQGSYVWLFPKNNVLWYPHKALEKYLRETFQRIDTIDIHLKDFHTLAIDITERKPVAMWCDDADEEQCYFMDQNSTIFSPAPIFSGDAYFKYYGLLASTSPIGREYIASSTVFSDIFNFIAETKTLGLRPQYLVAKDEGQFSLVVSGGGEIYFDVKEPLSVALQNLEALLRTSAFATTTDGDLPIQYIDLRYGNKLFYKLR